MTLLSSFRRVTLRLALTLPLVLASAEPAFAADTIRDLTHAFDAQTIYWPTEPGFVLQQEKNGVTERGYFYASNRFAAPEHGGTHIDAPHHFSKPGQTVEQIPLTRLVGDGVCVDVSRRCAADPDYLVTVEDLRDWEAEHGGSLEDKIVLLRTGYAAHLGDRTAYLGTSKTGEAAVQELHFPGLDPTAAEWLATKRRVKSVGIDTASIDNGPSQMFQSHVNLFRHNVPALENVALPADLPPRGFRVVALPMKIAGGSGAPCRVIAIVAE
ncbi:Kynurenine formamidase [Posidoniimonas corsicana]|uniref:Kynurenine formamidase n=1 Tax=Posidoniimonas corsicana TaxID=1938618 RepID=A0A5C5VG19_9BACT|nr:cyclase family protein [Posidoniimonas corsicana]TWT36890.1 Kynurenine formamidase [Posidoniimonas corsicana]